MLVLFDIYNKNDINIIELLKLRNACAAGLVNMSKTEWDDMDYHNSLFLLMYESKKQEKEMNEIKRKK
jgi:hypothetical protein